MQLPSTDRFLSPQAQKWVSLLKSLPEIEESISLLDSDTIQVDSPTISKSESDHIFKVAEGLKPWRKGPYQLFGHKIDAEWKCQLKWQRFSKHLDPIKNKRILDIGCNSGYFSFRLAANSPKEIVAIDPAALYYFQFHFLNHFFKASTINYQPIGFEDTSLDETPFDIILNMGILYHHPNPVEQLKQCHNRLSPNGQLILDTLILDNTEAKILNPTPRYAKMKNVYAIPSISTLKKWLAEANFKNIDILSIDPTTSKEQRVTPWSSQASLSNFLDPNNPQKTIEGYPAPIRICLKASR